MLEIFIEEIRMDVNHLNGLSKQEMENRVEMKRNFNKIIQNSSVVKEFSEFKL